MTTQTKIQANDIRFFPSERLTDNDDGGGMPLGTPISGESNELFKPISGIARVNGAFHLRLVYGGVLRDDDEPLIGSFAAITKPPSDPTVSYLLARATNYGELRKDSIKRIEAYNVANIESRMTLLSTQSQASRLVQAYQTVGEPLPLVGDVYCLRQKATGLPTVEQYVQVTKVTSETRTFTRDRQNFDKVVVKMEISGRLEHDFVGVEYPTDGAANAPTKILETGAVDAAQYYGVKPLAAAIQKTDTFVKVTSIMEKIVPTNQIEVRLNDLNAAGTRQTLLDGSKAGADGIVTIAIAKTHSTGTITSLYAGNAITPNTLSIIAAAGTIKDKGASLVVNETVIGTVNHAAGEISITDPAFNSYLTSMSFRPAGQEQQVGDTASIPVSINNRGYTWSKNINPPPAPGSLQVSYRAQGRWYTLRDDGDGVLRGASPAHGSGSVSFVTGTASISAGELPDVGSSVLFTWGGKARYFNRADSAAKAYLLLQLTQDAMPSSINLSWTDGTAKTAVSDAAGNITGDWTGKYDPKSRTIRINAGAGFKHPAGALSVQVQYATGAKNTGGVTLSKLSAGKVTFTAGALLPNSLQIDYELPMPPSYGEVDGYLYVKRGHAITARITDDAQGSLIRDGVIVGTIDYATGAGSFDPSMTARLPKAQYGSRTETVFPSGGNGGMIHEFPKKTYTFVSGYTYEDVLVTLPDDSTTPADIAYFTAASEFSVTETVASGVIEVDLLPLFSEVVTPSSVRFSFGDKTYFDRLGNIYTDLNINNGAATFAGNIDYKNAKATLTNWQSDPAKPLALKSLLTSLTGNPVTQVTFRTPSAPLRPDQLELWATALDGSRVSATATLSGTLSAASIEGVVDSEFGVVSAQFGKWVVAAGKESEPWYSADAIRTDGKIWQPLQVFADTITYNATSFSFLPIDSTVVKIDTVRLPQDGRIPIFRRGDTIIIGNRQTTDIGSAHTGGQTVTLPRKDVQRIGVVDADDKPVNAELWDYDLAAGTITWKTPLDLSTYKMPLKVNHAREEKNRITELDIDGTLNLLFSCDYDYPIEGTYVSSVLIGGDLQVRVSIPFTQRNWNNVWQDTPVGEQLLNKLNLKDYPMLLTDDGAIKDRWLIKMTGTNTFELYSEALGFVMRGDTLTDLAPLNPATGKPYFTIPKQAFGNQAPWASQDVIRFNTWGTLLPMLVLCAVQPNKNPPQGTDGYTMCLYGDTTEMTV